MYRLSIEWKGGLIASLFEWVICGATMENQVIEPTYGVLGMEIKNPIIVGSGLPF